MEACDKLFLIQAEFDGELDARDAITALEHRASCAACQEAYAAMEAVRQQMREAPHHRASPELRRALREGLAATAPLSERRRGRSWWREGGSFALGAGLAAAIALFVVMPAQQQPVLDQIVAGHIRALQPGHLEDVVSTDQHTVKPWFDGKLDFAPPVKDLAATGFPLLGGRLDYLDGRAVAALVYRHDKHIIDLYIWPATESAAPSAAVSNGYNAIHWSEKGMSLWVVSDLEADQLHDFVQQWQAL
jgi:anti-sigma factor RsiW